jgi:hypothetical protein
MQGQGVITVHLSGSLEGDRETHPRFLKSRRLSLVAPSLQLIHATSIMTNDCCPIGSKFPAVC